MREHFKNRPLEAVQADAQPDQQINGYYDGPSSEDHTTFRYIALGTGSVASIITVFLQQFNVWTLLDVQAFFTGFMGLGFMALSLALYINSDAPRADKLSQAIPEAIMTIGMVLMIFLASHFTIGLIVAAVGLAARLVVPVIKTALKTLTVRSGLKYIQQLFLAVGRAKLET